MHRKVDRDWPSTGEVLMAMQKLVSRGRRALMKEPFSTFRRFCAPAIRTVDVWLGREPRIGVDHKLPVRRFGSDYGGWYVAADLLDTTSVVYSFGVGTDVSFDVEIIDCIGVSVHGFDPTPISVAWVKQQRLPGAFHFHEWGLADRDGSASFRLPPGHAVSYAMISDDDGGVAVTVPVMRLATIMKRLGHEKVDLLKLDIEGAEYAVIDDIARGGVPVDQLLIEFHHRFPDRSPADTSNALQTLRGCGFRVVHVSPSGHEVTLAKRHLVEN